MQRTPTILVFDSGFGGLTVLNEVVKARPDARYIYVADNAAFPYGNLSEDELSARVLDVFEVLMAEFMPDLAVIACNTASTVVLPLLRGRFSIPFVGTVPAIKPAAQASASKLISVLATPGTVKRDYTHNLIEQFAEGCEVTLVGSSLLATIAEAKLYGQPVREADVAAEIASAFVEKNGKRTDQVVLACTHYPLLLEEMNRLAPWQVRFVDPAPAIARRVVALLGPSETQEKGEGVTALFTGRIPDEATRRMLTKFDIARTLTMARPLTRAASAAI